MIYLYLCENKKCCHERELVALLDIVLCDWCHSNMRRIAEYENPLSKINLDELIKMLKKNEKDRKRQELAHGMCINPGCSRMALVPGSFCSYCVRIGNLNKENES